MSKIMNKLFLFSTILLCASTIAMQQKQHNQDATNKLQLEITKEERKLSNCPDHNLYPNEMQDLILAGADPNVRSTDKPHNTALILSAGRGWEFTRFLLGHGADPNATNDNNDSPLERMAATSAYEIMMQFIQYGAHVDGIQGQRALQVAVHLNRPTIVGLLLENGAAFAIDRQNEEGETPLSDALKSGSRKVLNLLQKYKKQKLP